MRYQAVLLDVDRPIIDQLNYLWSPVIVNNNRNELQDVICDSL